VALDCRRATRTDCLRSFIGRPIEDPHGSRLGPGHLPRIVQLHGGKIQAENREGGGAVFRSRCRGRDAAEDGHRRWFDMMPGGDVSDVGWKQDKHGF